LAVGVENAAVICCFLTSEYQDSIECKIELQYAQKRSIKIIPCMLVDPNIWKPSGWLQTVIDRLEHVEFSVVTNTPNPDNIAFKLELRIYALASSLNYVVSTKIDEPSYLYEMIKYDYLRKSRIERFMNPEESFPIKDSYINLVIVNAKDQQEKENQMRDMSHHTAILGTYENIYAPKTSIDVKNIFEPCKTSEKQVLVFGRAGIGKSTFCRFVAYQWAAGAHFQQYEILVVIQLRNLTPDRYPQLQNRETYSPIDIVRREVFKDDLPEEDEKLFKQQFDAKKILWILDGYDELAQNVPAYFKDLLKKLLETPHHIVTSRPYLNTLSYNVKMEITGFTDENIKEYVYQFFHQQMDESIDASNKSRSLLEFLQLSPSVFGVAHIPVNLELICSIWSDDDFSSTQNLTVTSLYSKMIEWLCRRYLKFKTINENLNILSDDEIYEKCQQELAFLQCLAFEAIKENQIIIQATLLKKVLKQLNVSLEQHPHILNFGVLKASNKKGTGTSNELEKNHYFIHLSFQEYFAAQYVINQLNGSSRESAIEFIQHQKYNQRYALIFTFVAGLYSKDSTGHSFLNIIHEEPRDLVGIRHMQLIISSLQATSEHGDTDIRTNLLERIAQIIPHNIRMYDTHYKNYLLRSLKSSQSVTCHKIITNVFINLLQSEDPKVKQQTLWFVANTITSNPPHNLFTLIVDSLCNTNSAIKVTAWYAVGNIGEKAATKEVIDKLVIALTDEDAKIRRNACYAVGNIGQKAATKVVIDKLAIALTDEDRSVRESAFDAVGKIGEKATTKEVIDKLVIALTDEDAKIRRNACYAVGNIGEKAATKVVIDKLVIALTDEDAKIRRNACDAVGNIGEKAATKEVIDKLVIALTDENANIRPYAWYAVGKIGEKAVTKEVIDKLVIALTDEDANIRRNAWYAVGKIGEKAVTKEVIDKLVIALTDENANIRPYAWYAVGKIGEKAVTKEVIDKLVIALTDEDANIRRNAWYAVGKIGEKAATKEVIDKLVIALTDEDEEVRESACYAVGKIDEKAATKEVIDKLVIALTNEDANIRRNAWYAVGKIGEKAVTKEVIDKLVIALTDEDANIRRNACYAVGNIGEKAATKEVIDKLVIALTDENANIRPYAFNAVGKIGEKATTKEIIDKLVIALTDENANIRRYVCCVVGKIGEKAATKEVIDKLVIALTDKDKSVRISARNAVGKIGEKAATKEVVETILKLALHNDAAFHFDENNVVMKILTISSLEEVDPELLYSYGLKQKDDDILKNFSIDQLLNIWLRTKNCHWLSLSANLLVLRAGAVVLNEKTVVVYETKEPIEIPIPSESLREQLRKVFTAEREKLFLSFD